MTTAFFIKQLDEIVEEFNGLVLRSKHYDLSGGKVEDIIAIISKAKAAVARITGTRSEYYKDVDSTLKITRLYEGEILRHIIGTIRALRSDLQNDYLKSLSEIIQSEVFSDYLEMADHLLSEGYKDPAAVLVGSTLEAHLRELCKANKIDLEITNAKGELVPKKADVINSELKKAGVYNELRHKQIIAWLGVRNAAAHGEYHKYTLDDIKLMVEGVRQFILTTS